MLFLALIALASAQSTTTLRCTLDNNGKPQALEVEINESAGTVGWVWPETGATGQKRGEFSPRSVVFGPFSVSRETLAIVRSNDVSLVRDGWPALSKGQCEVATPKRAF